jgi:hypothetical protein
MGSLAAGGAAAMGTGAFSSVSANRNITVDVVGDASAFLSFEKTDSPNSDYVRIEDDGTISLAFDGSHAKSSDSVSYSNVNGLNDDAFTIIGEMFDITNRGTQDIFVWIPQNPDGDEENELGPGTGISFASGSANEYVSGTGLLDTQTKTGLPNHPKPSSIRVDVGNTMPDVGAIFGGYLGDVGQLDDLDIDLKIKAQSVDSFANGDSTVPNDVNPEGT